MASHEPAIVADIRDQALPALIAFRNALHEPGLMLRRYPGVLCTDNVGYRPGADTNAVPKI